MQVIRKPNFVKLKDGYVRFDIPGEPRLYVEITVQKAKTNRGKDRVWVDIVGGNRKGNWQHEITSSSKFRSRICFVNVKPKEQLDWV